ncbi:60S ribosomal protein L6 / eL6 [Leishmania donovani]|uniref:60S ribosomal protein L6 n=4 Tax=Leishmania donovani species complex TaxID=38574 RepID=A0A6L0WWK5_LEIIN|nr:putative 60S ribosomal protein L6 [Leishmania infantum JPCM5]XP_001468157.1 putative 60S ribosomal protein L6 [Leishmania infantum JPCM5]3JCS_F Chain F, ribosomal protein L6e [Leishmania donovani]6AZ3_F Chain F, ribosomal protein eL6 [Leishmania donovani]CAC9472775.1 Ribosomal_protein_L6e_-_putative [Leishmania infantum]AYU77520.1 60S ribosomal protein L6, putative [Leishmania donovani]AYU82045.1 60S ribosomal protein L6, putative [Leishmania donovani]TPP47708.1 Ribosomal protein L6e fami|eukprot:XP_001464439.1 putative 60S ribosomal protein L6 [Leishmania infantum JPCM5]
MAATKSAASAAKRKAAKKVSRKSPEYTTLRKSCAPGVIAIILAGRFRGRRAVILKQLPHNGPLVVSGPMKYNGVPIRRIDSRYVIATSTKVDISSVDTAPITPEVFQRPKAEKLTKSEGDFMGDKQKARAEKAAKKTSKAGKKTPVSDARAQLQKKIDAALIAAIKKDAQGKEKAGYLRSVFTVKPGDAPHRWNW